MVLMKRLLIIVNLVVNLWIDTSFGENLRSQYNILLSINTGYNEGEVVEVSEINSTVIEQLKFKIVNDLRCSYIFSGLHYVNLSRYLIENEDETMFKELDKYKDRLWFDDLSISILTFMYNCGQIASMEPFWWIYMYTQYFGMVVDGQIERNSTIVSSTCDAVVKNLSNCLSECDPNNSYNSQFHRTESFTDIPIINSLQNKGNNTLKLRSKMISTVLHKVREQIIESETVASPDNGKELFDFDNLKLYHVMINDPKVFSHLMIDFGELNEWQSTLKLIQADYSTTVNDNRIESRFVGIGLLQSKFICLLKIIMLQIILKHINYINDLIPPEGGLQWFLFKTIYAISSANNLMSVHLSTFVEFMNLHDDDCFKVLIAGFKNNVKNAINVKDNNDIIDKIYMYLKDLSDEFYGCQLSYPKTLNEEYVSKSLTRLNALKKYIQLNDYRDIGMENSPLKESILSATVFINYIQLKFLPLINGNDKIKIIQSFISFSQKLSS